MSDITGEISISSARFAEIKKETENLLEFKKAIERSSSEKATQLIELILVGSLNLDASDLHFEPEEEKSRIRLRIDGMLQDITSISKPIYDVLLSRIKLLSGLKLNVSDRPQDGRFSINTENSAIEIRSSTLPAEKGEAIVLRILNPKNLMEMEALGLRNDLREIFQKEIQKPNGMIIVTGPTGSGKTTTLYAFLKKIQKPEIKIITIEDPIEYRLEGVSQTQVQPQKGYDFATGLKSIVRQDPDVILVGEIRDLETVNIALQAALTGHLVFTTLHTNDAAGTVARLVSLGAKPSNIGPAVNLTIAQRLVRTVCKKCSSLEKVSPKDLQKITKELKGLPKNVKLPKITANLKTPKIKGCAYCNLTGYRGRIGIYESFLIDDEVEKFILKDPSIAALKEIAVKKGMVTIKQDGFIKVLEGLTTIEEVERVTGE
ncbi:MAG: type II/IV secretion system protein [Candidatus Nealsonbacteria bacterium]|nr:type II/IV secretion system protein [Candidatus Nealsonbacteria bacterium]